MPSTVVQSAGGVSLLSNSDGTWSVNEGGTITVIRDMGSNTPFTGGGIIAAGYYQGYRVVVFSGGHTWYMNGSWQKDSVGPANASTTQLNQTDINTTFLGITAPPPPPTPVVTSTVIESAGGVSLLRNSDGTFSAQEGGVSTLIKDMGSNNPSTISNMIAAGYHDGYRVVVFEGGHTWYMNANWQKDSVGPNGNSTTQLTQAQINADFFGGPAVTTPPVTTPPTGGQTSTSTLVLTANGVSLYHNTDGTWVAKEGANSTVIKDMGSSTGTTIGNIVAAGYHNGFRVVVFAGGHTWYMNANWQKDAVGPSGASTTQLSQAEINADFFGGPPVTTTPGNTNNPSVPQAMVVLQSAGGVSLVRNTDGTLAAQEGGVLTPIKDFGSSTPLMGGVIAVGYHNGFRVAVFGSGHTWYMNANWQKDNVGPNGASTTELTSAEVNREFFSGGGAAAVVTPPTSLVPVTFTVVLSVNGVELLKNSDGTWSVREGAAITLIKDMGSSTPTTISNIVAAGYLNGYKVVVFNGGHTWYMNANWQKDNVGPGNNSTTQLSQEQINATFFGGPAVVVTVPGTPEVTSSVVLKSGTVTLSHLSDGTWSVQEGTTTTLIKDMGGIGPTKISNIVAAGYLGNYRVVVFDGGHTWYMNANWQKDNVGPGGNSTTQLTPTQINTQLLGQTSVVDTLQSASLVMSSGNVTLYKDASGAWFVKEGSAAAVPMKNLGSDAPVTISDVVAAGYHNGFRVVVFSNGHTWYMNANWQKASVGPGGADTTQLTPAQIATEFFGASPGTSVSNTTDTAVTVTSTPFMSSGGVSLLRNSDGTWTVKEGSTSTLIKDMGSIGPTKIGNIVAAGYDKGFRVVVFEGGHTWYMNANWQKSNEGPGGASTTQLSQAQINADFFGGTPVSNTANTTNASAQLAMSSGTVSLLKNADGTWTAQENGVASLIKDMGSLGPTVIPNIVAAGYSDGYRVVVFNGGHTWYMNASWQKDNVGPNGASTTQLTQSKINADFFGVPASTASSVTSTLIESAGNVSLLKNSDGTWYAEESGTKILIKDAGGLGPTTISNIIAAGYDNGHRVVVFSGGHTWYVNANWQKDNVGPNGASTTQLSQAQINADFFGGSAIQANTNNNVAANSQFVGSVGGVTLLKNVDGTWTVKENGDATYIKDMNSTTPTSIGNIVAAGYLDGYRVVVFSGGHTWYMNANWQKDASGPGGASTTNLAPDQINSNFYGGNAGVIYAQPNSIINGTSDLNAVVFNGDLASHSLVKNGDVVLVSSSASSSSDQSMLANVERIHFDDAVLALDTQPNQAAGQTALIIGAVFPGQSALNAASQPVLGAVINLLDQNFSLPQLSQAMLSLPIWNTLTGKAAPTTTDIAEYLVNNIYEGKADAATFAAAVSALKNDIAQGDFLTALINSKVTQTHVGLVGIQETGLVYVASGT